MSDEQCVNWLSSEQQRIWRAWLLAKSRIEGYLDCDLRRFGLDLGEYEILVTLSELPRHQMRMSDLAQAVHQSRSRLTHTVSRMERDGLLERRGAKDDRRGVLAQLTAKGFCLLKRAAPHHVAAVREIFIDAVTPEDFEALGRAMFAVLDVADSKRDHPDIVGPYDLPACTA